jgi:hypothetical protein
MAKKKKSASVFLTVFKNIGMGIAWVIRNIWLAIEWFGFFIWDIIHRVFELVFWVWGFVLVTILIVTAAFLFLSLGFKALDDTTYSENLMKQFLPNVLEQQQAQSLPDILSEFNNKEE